MAETSAATPERAQRAQRPSVRSLLTATEIDTRLLGMVVALVVIWVGFDVASGHQFLTFRNMWNLSVQTASVAVMATGMVLIIVSRNIDLSVGSVLGLVGMTMGMVQAEWIPKTLGFDFNQPWIWVVAVIVGLLLGAAVGAFQGFIIAYVGVPSFIVTLGGLLVWRGVAWTLAAGRTIAPMDKTFQKLGGGPLGSIGEQASWLIAILVCVGIVAVLINGRRRRRRFGFPLRPMWAEITLGVLGCLVAIGAVWAANSYPWPVNLARQYAQDNGIDWPAGGLTIGVGIANPVLIALGVALVMTFLAVRRRFGRYVFAIGGNPEAAELGGINTRRIVMQTFILMGVLAAVSAAISTARLNAATNGAGTGAELQVIAAAVIGGTSFAGGIGTIPGAVLGALVMQSLVSGMVLLRVDSPLQDIAVGIVLVTAVGIDTIVRRRAK